MPQTMSPQLRRRETVAGYMFLLPSLIFFIGFVVVPMVMCVVTSFFDANMNVNTPDKFIWFDNYIELWKDPVFIKALKNTFIIVVVSVPFTCIFSLWVASAIYKMREGLLSFFRIVFYLPVVTGSVAVTVVWKWMYNNYYGIFNYVLKNTGVISKNINWLGDPKYALWCIILILLTTSVGQPIVLYVSALSNVDNSLRRQQPAGVLADQVAPDHAHHPVHPGHHHHQLLPVLRPHPAAHQRRAQLLHGDGDVLHLLHRVQAIPLRLRQRHGRDPGHLHRHIERHPVPPCAGEIRG